MRALSRRARFLVVGAGRGRARCSSARPADVLDVTLSGARRRCRSARCPALLAAATVATSLFMPVPEMESNSANKFFDALAAGRPVAINYGGWHRQLLTESGAGIALDPKSDPRRAARDAGRPSSTTPRAWPARPRRPGGWRASGSTATALAEEFAAVLERVAGCQMSAA